MSGTVKPCKPCAAARKFVPAPVRKRLEEMERRRLERKAAKQKAKHAGW